MGFSAILPWSHQGISATAIGISYILWLTVTHITTSGIGGYLSGLRRIRWASLRSDEVYFRDTAHGLVVGNIVSNGVHSTRLDAGADKERSNGRTTG